MFKVGDKVSHFNSQSGSDPSEVLEVDAIGNIRISNDYPPKFHHYQNFCLSKAVIEQHEPAATGIKHDQDKVDMSLLSPIALEKIAQVMTFGKKKYSAHNWRGGFVWSRPLAAALRHLLAFMGGQDKDPETGLSHLAHAACCICFLLEFEDTKPELDDRYKGGK